VTEEQLAKVRAVAQDWYILCDIFEIDEIDPSEYITTEDFKLMTYASLSGSMVTDLSEETFNAIISAGPRMADLVEKLEAESEDSESED
jgi:hypothetical protein